MAWVAFQKPNWNRATIPTHSNQYFPAASNGTATGNLTFTAGAIKTVTLTAAFQFKGNGGVLVTAPEGSSSYQTAAAAGVMIDNAWLQGPGSGNYAAGNHPVILCNLSSAAAYTTAATGFDLIAWQL